MKFAVVGSGPCGAITSLLLLENGFSVDLITLNNNEKSDKKDLDRKLKLVNGDSSPYDINQLLDIEVDGEEATFYRSKVVGGFSNVWGATWDSPMVSQDLTWLKHYKFVDQLIQQSLGFSNRAEMKEVAEASGCNCLSFLNDFNSENLGNFTRSDLAVNNHLCECVALGKDYCSHGAVWNSTSLINSCRKYKSFRLLESWDVRSIRSDADGLYIQHESGELKYDSVTLAAGPIGISSILLKSDFQIRRIVMSETRMGYMPYLKFRLNSGHPGSFAFSQYRFDLPNLNGLVEAHIQLYAHAELYKKRIENKIPKGLRSFAAKVLCAIAPHMGIALIYLKSDYSEMLKIEENPNRSKIVIEKIPPRKKRNGLLKKLRDSFKEMGLFPMLPVLSWARIGESYHLGAAQDLLDEYGFLKAEPRISVAGSFALPSILPGPITHASMAQSSRLVERIVYQNLDKS